MSLRLKLILSFFTMGVVPLCIIGFYGYYFITKVFLSNELSHLESVVELKTKTIENFFYERKADIRGYQEYYNIQKNLPALIQFANNPEHSEYKAAKTMLDKQLEVVRAANKYVDIMLVDLEGRIIYSVNPSHINKDIGNPLPDPGGKAFENGKLKIFVSDIFYNQVEDNHPGMLITAPVTNLNGSPGGVIALEIDMSPVYQIIEDTTGLGQSGETLVGRKVDHFALFLNPLRHDPTTALEKKVLLGGREALPIQQAVQGINGAGKSIDYRDKEVIAVWRYSPLLGWGIVGKIDVSEVFKPADYLFRILIFILIFTLLLISGISFFLIKSILNPINDLVVGTTAIGEGNFDYIVKTQGRDEIGQLSRAFDHMARKLKIITVSRNELAREISERTKAEDLARSTQHLLSLILDTIPVRVFWKDKDLSYMGCNANFIRDAGLESSEQILGLNDFQLPWSELAEDYRADDRQVIASGTPKLDIVERLIKSDKSVV